MVELAVENEATAETGPILLVRQKSCDINFVVLSRFVVVIIVVTPTYRCPPNGSSTWAGPVRSATVSSDWTLYRLLRQVV